ncbi:hypothetical protein NW768_000102 [Fusarium equiseti]|uniref:U3 snorna associated n=2 Tax=Fusarium incarnatum-equiseti species complex TaxID=450425 RepID=A0ABQ8RRI0_FUSEQ|nr:hypothetical protein NW768_000102 [Fusarium equiseti]
MAPLTRKRKAEQKTTKAEETPVERTSEEKRKLPVRAKDGEPSSPEQPKATKVVFGDDDDMSAPVAPVKKPAPAPKKEEIEDSDEDSDDEAPEAVSTSKVASEIKKSKQAAQKAAQEQAAAEKKKRRERDVFFKQQAEERKKLEEEEKEKAEKEASAEENEEEEEPAQSLMQQKALNLLPAELLEDSSSEDEAEMEEDDQQEEERPRKRRVATVEKDLARQNRGPKDERIGSTVYRVAKKTDQRMMPKLNKQGKNRKDDLLKRGRSAVKPRSGFFVK